MLGDESSITLLSKMMELSSSRQKVIANNLANANTPGYTRRELDFESELKNILSEGNLRDLHNLEGRIVEDGSGTRRNDGNNVNITSEMNEMSQNGVMFSLVNKAFKSRVGIIKSAIR
ncbi:MAG: flagellar basal body rod protein FlgB [Lentisphaeraceae bacterium]|nr:flagellar basal body rod protein FlgB [Lentisphaeraceae bacterium]